MLSFRKGRCILISYEPLWQTMKFKDITTYTLIDKHGISSRTINNLKHNKGITVFMMEHLCKILDCTPKDIIKFIKEYAADIISSSSLFLSPKSKELPDNSS